jgi:hypothetical protein
VLDATDDATDDDATELATLLELTAGVVLDGVFAAGAGSPLPPPPPPHALSTTATTSAVTTSVLHIDILSLQRCLFLVFKVASPAANEFPL